MPFEQKQHHDRHPILHWIGHALGIVYILVTLLFGPIKALARWLEQHRLIQRYEHWVAGLPPAAGLAAYRIGTGADWWITPTALAAPPAPF